MRAAILILVGSLSAAAADPLPPVDPGAVPAECAAVAKVPASATIAAPAIEARIAAASCAAMSRFKALQPASPEAALTALADAAKPSFALLDGAIAANDPVWTPVAQKIKANIYQSMVTRARNTIPPITMQTVGQALADHDQAHASLEPKLKAWLDQAH